MKFGKGHAMTVQDYRVFREAGPGIRAGFSDSRTTADEMREMLTAGCEAAGGTVIRLKLVHGDRIDVIRAEDPRIVTEDGTSRAYLEIPETDGGVTDVPGVVLTSTHGDCLAVYLADPVRGAVGLAHAGWKGTLLEIGGKLARKMQTELGCRPEDLRAYISPGISACCFQVRADVRDAFAEGLPLSLPYISRDPGTEEDPRWHIDLKAINRESLLAAGVLPEHVSISPDCTCCGEERWYSYRRNGEMRRMLAWIGRKPAER